MVAEPIHQNLQWNLEKQPVLKTIMEIIARTFIIPSRPNQFKPENFSINSNKKNSRCSEHKPALARACHLNLFNCQQFGSTELAFDTGCNLYLNIRDTYLSLKLQLFKERLFDCSLEQVTEVIFLGNFSGEWTNLEQSLKIVFFFSFRVPIKRICFDPI